MSEAARHSYGQARVRARKARLMPVDALVAAATSERSPSTGVHDVEIADDPRPLVSQIYGRLTDDYRVAMSAFAAARGVLQAMVGLHELENVKLLWRCAIRHAAAGDCRRLWRPLGALATVSSDRCERIATSPQALAEALSGTPYAEVAASELRAHAGDLAAVEFALDRFGSTRLAEAAAELPRRELLARELAEIVVRVRDLAIMQRAIDFPGLTPEIAVSLTSLYRHERRLGAAHRAVADYGAARRRLKTRCQDACRRAFLGDPFSLALPIAFVLMRERESRLLIVVSELRARHASAADARRVLDTVA
jgi:vacuolar-type H+-ATPase subunit C/Vma6